MDKSFSFRTDMADEARRLWLSESEDNALPRGVEAYRGRISGLDFERTDILDSSGEQALKKARGRYYSLVLPKYYSRGSADFSSSVSALSQLIKGILPHKAPSALIAALGNPAISPDALGDHAADHILVTRHLKDDAFSALSSVSLCRPGVLGCSGMESALQVKKLCELVSPDLVIVIDALAGSDPERLCRCVQLSNAGISPGSGVGNDRQELSIRTLGIPVISLGMPTVIDAANFGDGAMNSMFVTARDIDCKVRDAGKLIAYAINLALHPGLGIEDVDAFIG